MQVFNIVNPWRSACEIYFCILNSSGWLRHEWKLGESGGIVVPEQQQLELRLFFCNRTKQKVYYILYQPIINQICEVHVSIDCWWQKKTRLVHEFILNFDMRSLRIFTRIQSNYIELISIELYLISVNI